MAKYNFEKAGKSIRILKNVTMIDGEIVGGVTKSKKFSQLKEGVNKIKYGRKVIDVIKKGKGLSYKDGTSEYEWKKVEDDADINANFQDDEEVVKLDKKPKKDKKGSKKTRNITHEDDEDVEEIQNDEEPTEVKNDTTEVKEDVYKIKENIVTKNGEFFLDVSNGNFTLLKNIKRIEMDPNTAAFLINKFKSGSVTLDAITSKIKMAKGCTMMRF
jgi:hypothetical protein